jgi:hypothetical protein
VYLKSDKRGDFWWEWPNKKGNYFIGGEDLSPRIKPLTCEKDHRKTLLHNVVSSTPVTWPSMIYMPPVQNEHVKRKRLDLEAVLSG